MIQEVCDTVSVSYMWTIPCILRMSCSISFPIKHSSYYHIIWWEKQAQISCIVCMTCLRYCFVFSKRAAVHDDQTFLCHLFQWKWFRGLVVYFDVIRGWTSATGVVLGCCRNPGLNQGPLDLQSNALPTELFRQNLAHVQWRRAPRTDHGGNDLTLEFIHRPFFLWYKKCVIQFLSLPCGRLHAS